MPSTKEKKKEIGSGQLPATQPQPEAPDELQPPVHIQNGQSIALQLFDAKTPQEVLVKATAIAKDFKKVIDQAGLSVWIDGKEYVKVEGWTTLGAMLGVFPFTEKTERIEESEGNVAYKARAISHTLAGITVSAGEMRCSSQEVIRTRRGDLYKRWNGPDGKPNEFAILSMAQTRATGKCLRLPLGWIITLAGFQPTPAEEMESLEYSNGNTGKSNGVGQAVAKLIKEHPLPKDFRTAFHKNLTDWKLTPEQAKVIIANHLKIEDPKKIKFAGNTKEMLTRYNAILLHYRMQEKKEPEGKQEVKEPKKSQKAKKPAASSSPEKLTDLKKRVLGFIPEGSAMPNDLTLPVTKWAEMQFKKLGDVKGLKEVIPFVRLYLPAEFKAELRKYPEFQGALGGG